MGKLVNYFLIVLLTNRLNKEVKSGSQMEATKRLNNVVNSLNSKQ